MRNVRCVVLAVAVVGLGGIEPGGRTALQAAGQSVAVEAPRPFVRPLTAGWALRVCGNGVQTDGELCFLKPVLVMATTSDPNWIETGYINGGDNLDVVASVPDANAIRIKLGAGNGTFPGTYTWSMGTSPIGVKLADFNGDGMTDIIAARYPDDRIRIRWGHSNWSTYSNYVTDNGPITVDVGDLNGDGLDDFVTAGLSLTLTVRLRQAGGGFTNDSYGGLNGGYVVVLGDCNNDGHLDLIYPGASGGSSRIKVRLNDGSGSFGPAQNVNTGNSAVGIDLLTTGDYDNDGNLDIIAARGNTLVRVLGNGNGTFGPAASAPVTSAPCRIRTFDVDGDGNEDFVVGNQGSSLDIYLGDGNGSFAAAVAIDGLGGICDIHAGDFNGDDALDIVYGGTDGVYLLTANP